MQRERRKNNDILFHFRKDGLPMTKLSQLKIDPEFQNQINPPSFEETHQLEMNILKEERVLNPIITWNGYIVDGHTRYQILRKYPFIPFEVIEKEFSSRYEALVWICKNQLGRRNLTPEQKKFLIGKQAEAEKQIKSFHGNQYTLASESGLVQNEPDRTKHGSRSKVAAEHGTSESYVYRAEQFAKGVEAAEEAVPGAQKEILSGKIRATDREISSIAKIPKEKRPEVVAELRKPKGERDSSITDAADGIGTFRINKSMQRVRKEALNQVDDGCIIKVFPDKLERSTTSLILKSTKTASSCRTIFMTSALKEELKKWLNQLAADERKDPARYHDSGMLFRLPNGLAVEPVLIRKKFLKWQDAHPEFPRIVFHGLRHSSATYQLMISGGDVKAVQGTTGHATADMLVNTYAHIQQSSRVELGRKFEEGFYAKSESPSPQAVPAAGEPTISMTALLELLKNADPEVKAQLRLALLT